MTKTSEKREHPQLRALLFNRLGKFKVPHNEGEEESKSDDEGPSAVPPTISTPLSQQYLKDSSSSSKNDETRERRAGMIRFNSIVSVVGIPSREQYSGSVRRLLWGSKRFSFSFDEDDDNAARASPQPGDATASTVHSDNSSAGVKIIASEQRQQMPMNSRPSRHRLMRKRSFHN